MKLLPATEVAERWNCSIKTVYKAKDRGYRGIKLKYKRIMGMVRFPEHAVESFEAECKRMGGNHGS